MDNWITKVNNELVRTQQVENDLRALAKSFRNTGNAYMFDCLDTLADDLNNARECIAHTLGEKLDEEVKAGQSHVAETLLALLKENSC